MIKLSYGPQIFMTQDYGGVSRYFFELARRVSVNEGFSAKIIAPIHINNYIKNNNLVTGFFCKKNTYFHKLSYYVNPPLTTAINKFVSPDIIHDTYYNTYYSRIFSKKKEVKDVITVFDMIHEKYKSNFLSQDRTSIYKEKSVKSSDCILCISNSTKKDLIEIFDIDEKKIKVVYLGCSLPEKYKKIDIFVPFILYVGSRGGYKNFNKLVEAYASSKKIKDNFKLLAFGGGSWTKEEMDLFRKHNLDEKNIIYAEGDDSTLAGYYASAACFVYPSLYEGFGIPPLEAMNYGCPVACSGTSSLPEVVGDAALMFNPEDIDSMTLSLDKILFDDSCRQGLIRAGKVRSTLFSWDKCAEETMAVYSELMK